MLHFGSVGERVRGGNYNGGRHPWFFCAVISQGAQAGEALNATLIRDAHLALF